MAKQTKKFQLMIKDLEAQVGPVITGHPHPQATGPVFIAVFGTRPDASHAEVLGSGNLIKNDLVLGDVATVTALRAGARPTMVGIAWVDATGNHTQARSVANFGHRDGEASSSQDMWAMELSSPSTAPDPSSIPPGASQASGWCFLFPWLSMCHKN